MAYGDFKDWDREQLLILHEKTFSIAKNPKYDGYQHGVASVVYKFLT